MHRTAEQAGGKLMLVAPERALILLSLNAITIPFDATFQLIFAMRCCGDY